MDRTDLDKTDKYSQTDEPYIDWMNWTDMDWTDKAERWTLYWLKELNRYGLNR